jgi:hypothetical protein
MNIAGELDNVPAAALPSILLFIILTVLYILLLGPLNFLVLRRFRRREFMWVTIPLGAILCMGATFGVAYHLKGSTVLINTVGMVTLDGRAGPHPPPSMSACSLPSAATTSSPTAAKLSRSTCHNSTTMAVVQDSPAPDHWDYASRRDRRRRCSSWG